jgi:hypothetical protein
MIAVMILFQLPDRVDTTIFLVKEISFNIGIVEAKAPGRQLFIRMTLRDCVTISGSGMRDGLHPVTTQLDLSSRILVHSQWKFSPRTRIQLFRSPVTAYL